MQLHIQPIEEALDQLLKTNTLLGGEIPEISNVFKQLEALTQFCYPFSAYDGSNAIMFASPIWDTLNRYDVHREVFGVEAFQHRSALFLDSLGHDPYSFEVIKKFKPIGLQMFPDNKSVYMPSSFGDIKVAMQVATEYIKPTDTTIIVKLLGCSKVPKFAVQSVFNPFYAFLRQRQNEVCISPDLIAQAAKQVKPILKHKDIKQMVNSIINEGFNPQVGLNILPINWSEVESREPGMPYSYEAPYIAEVAEKKQASPAGFEL